MLCKFLFFSPLMQSVPRTFELEKAYKSSNDQKLSQSKLQYEKRVESNKQRALIQTEKLKQLILQQQIDLESKQKQAEIANAFYVQPEPEFFVAIRIRGMNRVPPKQRKALDLLRLRKPNACVLLRNNASIKAQLQVVRNYIAYGYINYDMLHELIFKRGFAKTKDGIVNLTNEIIEDHFDNELFCLEDLVYNLYNGNQFSKINRFLAPFALNCPKGGFKCKKKALDFLEGGMCGNQEYEIEKLISRMIN